MLFKVPFFIKSFHLKDIEAFKEGNFSKLFIPRTSMKRQKQCLQARDSIPLPL